MHRFVNNGSSISRNISAILLLFFSFFPSAHALDVRSSYTHTSFFLYLQTVSATHLINESQKEQELQRRHQQEQILQQQQKLQELQGQINAQYSGVVGTQSLMFFPLLEHLRGLQQPATLPPGVPKSPIPNHVSYLFMMHNIWINCS